LSLKNKFKLLTGEESITTYTFNTDVAKHRFCSVRGVNSFCTPRSNPDGVDINVNCLNRIPKINQVIEFDGQNWQEHMPKMGVEVTRKSEGTDLA
jgi:hypothetical protein